MYPLTSISASIELLYKAQSRATEVQSIDKLYSALAVTNTNKLGIKETNKQLLQLTKDTRLMKSKRFEATCRCIRSIVTDIFAL